MPFPPRPTTALLPKGLAFVAFALGIFGLSSPTSAQAVRVTLDPCVGIEEGTVRRIVLLELQTAERSADTESDTTTVTAGCSELGIRIEVRDPLTGKQSIRHLRLSRVDERAQARMLALSISELVSASWLELRVPSRAVAPIEQTASDEAQAEVRARPIESFESKRNFWIESFGLAQFGEMPFMGGWQLGLLHQAHPNFAWRLDIAWLRRTLSVDLGEVRGTNLRADLGLLAGKSWGIFRIDGQLGCHIGSVLLEGLTGEDNVEARTIRSAAIAPYLGLRITLQPAERFQVTLFAQGGLNAVGIEGRSDGQAAFSISGLFGNLGLGFGVRL